MSSKRSDVALKELCDIKGWKQLSYDYHATFVAPHSWGAAASLIVPQHGLLLGQGLGSNKKEAKPAAAADLLQQLSGLGLIPTTWSDPSAAVTTGTAGICAALTSRWLQVGFKNLLQERLMAPNSSKGLAAVYDEPLRDPTSAAHTPRWTAGVALVSGSNGAEMLAAVGSGRGKIEAQQAAARALLAMPEFEGLLRCNAAALAGPAAAAAATLEKGCTVPAGAATGAAAIPGVNYKNQLQELIAKAASRRLGGWLQLPQYSSSVSGPAHMRVFTATVTVQGPAGLVLAATGQAAPSKKLAEQTAAAAMLQLTEIQRL
jgi:dsRNA-specific ribonuclease